MARREKRERLQSVEGLLDKIDRSLERIELVTVVREPSTGMSADAYNGLRKQVIAATGERNAHLHQLAQFDAALGTDATAAELRMLVDEWLGQSSLVLLEDPRVTDAFELVGPADASGVRVVRPAYVDAVTGRVVRTGVAERYQPPVVEPEPVPEADAADVPPSSEEEPAAEDVAGEDAPTEEPPAGDSVTISGGQQ